MGVFDELLGLGADGIGSLLVDAREAITGKKILDPNEQAKLTAQLEQLAAGLQTGQMKINEAEAQSTNWFVAGWRPFVGWTCGAAFAYTFVLLPFMQFWVYVFAPDKLAALNELPHLDLATMMPVLLGMLGLGGMRSFEKKAGVQGEH